jgi:hypothetical protein
MKILIRLMDKMQARTSLDEQDAMIAEMPLYEIMGYKDVDRCVNDIKKELITKHEKN